MYAGERYGPQKVTVYYTVPSDILILLLYKNILILILMLEVLSTHSHCATHFFELHGITAVELN